MVEPDWLAEVSRLEVPTEVPDGKTEVGVALAALAAEIDTRQAGPAVQGAVLGALVARGDDTWGSALLVSSGDETVDAGKVAELFGVRASAVSLIPAADLLQEDYAGVMIISR